jgi:TPP-dependent 2-oxoacid decarboxylase
MPTKTVILDTNVFILYVLGLMEVGEKGIQRHKTTSIYTIKHFYFLLSLIAPYQQIVISPNIATEVDNLLNRFTGENRYKYIQITHNIFKASTEVYIETLKTMSHLFYPDLGVTDTGVLMMAKNCDLLISGDSQLCDYAKSEGLKVFDFKEYVNKDLFG